MGALSGCGGKPHAHALPEPPRVANCDPGIPGGRLVLAAPAKPQTFNPLIDDVASAAIVRLLFGSLVHLNLQSQEPEPGLAESWSVAADQKTWTFKLRKNLHWSDGQPLTADDVVFTWNEVMYNPKYNQVSYDLFRINGKNFQVTKVDDLTVRVVTPEVFAPFVEFFGGVSILPKHKLERLAASGDFFHAYAISDKPEDIVGSGPFRLKSYQRNVVLLERNPEFGVVDKKGQRLPYFDEVEILTPGSQMEYERSFLQGPVAALETIPLEQVPQFRKAAESGQIQVIDLGVGLQRDFLWFNQNTGVAKNGKPFVDPVKSKWFRDKRFREAISCAINRDRIIYDVYNGRAQAVYGFLSADNKKWNNPSVSKYSYDPDKARALLAQMGLTNWSNGVLADAEGHPVEFTFMYSYGNPIRKAVVAKIEEDLKILGIKVTDTAVDFKTLVNRIDTTMDYECASMGLGAGAFEPASQMNVLKSDAPLHQWFPSQRTPATDWEKRIDVLMDAQMRTLDFAQRKKYFDEVQMIWAEQMPMICIAAPSIATAIRTDLGNVRPAVAGVYHATWNIEELYFKK